MSEVAATRGPRTERVRKGDRAPGDRGLDAIAMALRDPELIAASVIPQLPTPTLDPTPTAAPAVFDARATVAASRRKAGRPVHGQAATADTWPGIDVARAAMRRKRRRNNFVGRVAALTLLAALVAGGYLVYREYQADQNQAGSVVVD